MKLLILYGPPGVGKLTVATELAKLTGFRLFHNHLTQDLAEELYPEFGEQRFKLVNKIRVDVIEYAAQNDTNLIHTFVYSNNAFDDAYLSQVLNAVDGAGGKVLFVQLTAKPEDIVQRMSDQSRKKFHKLTDSEVIRPKLERGDYSASVTYDGVYKVDTSLYGPQTTARRIVEYFGIEEVQ